MPTITICDGSQPIPSGMTCGEGAQFYSKISSTHYFFLHDYLAGLAGT